MYRVKFWYEGYGFTCGWIYETLAEAVAVAKEQESKGYKVRLERV